MELFPNLLFPVTMEREDGLFIFKFTAVLEKLLQLLLLLVLLLKFIVCMYEEFDSLLFELLLLELEFELGLKL